MFFSTFPSCTVLEVPHSHTSVVWCAGLEWILKAGSELVIHGFSSWAGTRWGVGICFKMLCVKMPALYWAVFGRLPPSRVASVSPVVGSSLLVELCSCTISKNWFPPVVYLFPTILNAGLINRHLYTTLPLTISKCWVEFNYTSGSLWKRTYRDFLNLCIKLWHKWEFGASQLISLGHAACHWQGWECHGFVSRSN